jgi:hypothetical protein
MVPVYCSHVMSSGGHSTTSASKPSWRRCERAPNAACANREWPTHLWLSACAGLWPTHLWLSACAGCRQTARAWRTCMPDGGPAWHRLPRQCPERFLAEVQSQRPIGVMGSHYTNKPLVRALQEGAPGDCHTFVLGAIPGLALHLVSGGRTPRHPKALLGTGASESRLFGPHAMLVKKKSAKNK